MNVILASGSRSRRQALDLLGLTYKVIPSNIKERTVQHKSPEKRAQILAEEKAKAVAKDQKDAIIIASDLFVVFNGKIYEKPKDKEEAFRMLKGFSRQKLQIVAGIAVYNTKTELMLSSTESYFPTFRKLTDKEIKNYIEKHPILEYAAGFAADGEIRFAEKSEGCFPFMYGIPTSTLILYLRQNNIDI